MEKLSHSHPVDVYWRSYELRPKGAPPIPAEYRAQIEAKRPQLYAIARQNYGLEMKPGPFGVDTRPALVGAKFAEAQKMGAAYHDRVMRAYWQEELKIDDPSVLADQAQAAGLDRNDFLAALHDTSYDQQVQEDVDLAQAYGLNGVPALVFNNKYLVSGAQPLHVLQNVVEKIQAE